MVSGPAGEPHPSEPGPQAIRIYRPAICTQIALSGRAAGNHLTVEQPTITANIACHKAATLSPSGAARPAVSPTSGLQRSDQADRRLLPGLISLPPSHRRGRWR
jgi:hypothetical protein